MKAITIIQPWASLIAVGAKQYETRSWPTRYRGPIAIHAGKASGQFPGDTLFAREVLKATFPQRTYDNPRYSLIELEKQLPHGAVIATARLIGCWRCIGPDKRGDLMIHNGRVGIAADSRYVGDAELLFGDFTAERYAWELADIKALDRPIPARGMQGLWEWKEGNQ